MLVVPSQNHSGPRVGVVPFFIQAVLFQVGLMTRSAAICLMAVAVTMGLAGCGGKSTAGRQSVYKAKGKLTFAGGPLVGASVVFAPKDKQPAATGRTNDAGEFVLTTYDGGDGAAAGNYAVLVLKEDPSSQAETTSSGGHNPGAVPDGSKMHAAQQAKKSSGGGGLPAKYGKASETPLSAKVEANGANEFNLDLAP